jgi:protein-S-isoprenylcysteine O-methyltransferase Ste14
MTLARYLCLVVPAAAVLGAARIGAGGRRRVAPAGSSPEPAASGDERAAHAGAFLAFLAAAVGIAALHEVATAANWYAFARVDGAYRGLPVDLWLGWAALWGPAPVLVRRWLPLPVALGLLLWVDAVAMPALDPLVRLGPHWLIGEALGLAVVALPAQLLGRWTADRRRLVPRVVLQLTVFTGLTLWLAPSVAFTLGDGSWDRLLRLPGSWLFGLGQLALAVALPALAAVREFATRGGGTPFPWDPPIRLVTTGVYAYLANPMQVSTVLLLLVLAVATRSRTLAAVVVSAVAFSAAVAAPHERHDLRTRHAGWAAYRQQVRDWWPRWRPHPAATPARLWLDDDCGPCAAVRDFLLARAPSRLTIVPAATYDRPLWRARYAADDGHTASGVAAIAHGLDHVSLGWAYAGWLLRMPVLDRLAQLVTDALIAPPHPAGPAVTAAQEP